MSSRNAYDTPKRAGTFTIGLSILSFGVAISIRANLGVGPIVAVPTVLFYATPLSVGTLTIIFNLVMPGVSMLIMGRNSPSSSWYRSRLHSSTGSSLTSAWP